VQQTTPSQQASCGRLERIGQNLSFFFLAGDVIIVITSRSILLKKKKEGKHHHRPVQRESPKTDFTSYSGRPIICQQCFFSLSFDSLCLCPEEEQDEGSGKEENIINFHL
jgi:hypothetical protein